MPKRKQFRLLTLFALTTLFALVFACCIPFQPKIQIHAPVDLQRYHAYYTHAKVYDVSIVNAGRSPVWLPNNSDPFASPIIGGFACGVRDDQVYVSPGERGLVRVAPGNGLIYKVCMDASVPSFSLRVEAQDWRGRIESIEKRIHIRGHQQ
ncbi:hypothetical protein [Rhodopirellula halodulae]|uniref:hypothetical protein n=1 Tax=Rhodopirellula halodulae TaxID=2894198 RepID=UPI001E4138E4|nr:hypothetical protein [Rhodopirellula sp. JC737]MCC9655383.1 hypothetical protein [Rhodopirellula sp. JC737]